MRHQMRALPRGKGPAIHPPRRLLVEALFPADTALPQMFPDGLPVSGMVPERMHLPGGHG